MEHDIAAIGIELIVEDLDRAIELFTTVMGCTLIGREPSTLIAGEVASIDAGSIVISLIKPTPYGPGASISQQEARLAQIIFGTPPAGVAAMFDRALAAGLSVINLDGGRMAVIPEAVKGATGVDVALVTVPVAD